MGTPQNDAFSQTGTRKSEPARYLSIATPLWSRHGYLYAQTADHGTLGRLRFVVRCTSDWHRKLPRWILITALAS